MEKVKDERIKVVIVFDDSEIKEALIDSIEIPDLLGSCASAVLRVNDNEIEKAIITSETLPLIRWIKPEKLED